MTSKEDDTLVSDSEAALEPAELLSGLVVVSVFVVSRREDTPSLDCVEAPDSVELAGSVFLTVREVVPSLDSVASARLELAVSVLVTSDCEDELVDAVTWGWLELADSVSVYSECEDTLSRDAVTVV